MIGFDTESTGVDTREARMLQAAIITCDPAGILKEDDRVLFVDPGPDVEIPREASEVHGITREVLMASSPLPHGEALRYIYRCISRRATLRHYPLVIYNAPYDWSLLIHECQRIPGFNAGAVQAPMFLDPLVIDRHFDKYRKGSRKLADVARHYGVELDDAHDAAADTRASIGVMLALIKSFPEIKELSLAELHEAQAMWYAAWKASLNSYWEKSGKQDRITGRWPFGE